MSIPYIAMTSLGKQVRKQLNNLFPQINTSSSPKNIPTRDGILFFSGRVLIRWIS